MKRFLIATIFVLISSLNLFAQKSETFDIISYKTPKGWQKEIAKDAVQFGIEDSGGGRCLISMFRSVDANSDSKINFDVAWENIVGKMVTLKSDLERQPTSIENGWTAESGFAQYENDGIKGLVMLVTLTGNSQMVNILTLTNTDAYQQPITEFLDSIVLPKVEVATAPQTAEPSEISNLLTQVLWKNTQNRKDNVGGYGGYSSNSYQFFANGTYKFTNTSFQTFAPKFSIVDEEGTYQINGNSITISPKKSTYHVHKSEKTDPPIGAGNLNLEVVKYSFEFTTIYDRQRLVLAPSTGRESKRDGAFNYYANGQMTKSYLYDAQ